MTDAILKQARDLAWELHNGQTRKGAKQEPYFVHLEEVANLVALWGGSVQAQLAAWLHDTVEDCPPYRLAEVEAQFGSDVAQYVGEVTDDKSQPKAERKRMQVVNAAGKSPQAALVKLADKTSNLRALVASPPVAWDRARRLAYVEWAESVVGALPAGLPDVGVSEFRKAAEQARSGLS